MLKESLKQDTTRVISCTETEGNKLNWILLFSSAFLFYLNLFVSITILPQYAMALGGTEFQAGLQNTLFFLTAPFLRLYFGPYADREGRKKPLLLGSFVFATTPLLLLASDSLWMLFAARIYQAVGLATFLQSGSSLVADMAPLKKRAYYLGVYRLLVTLAVLIGAPAAIYLIENSGYKTLFTFNFIAGSIGVILLLLLKPPPLPDSSMVPAAKKFRAIIYNKKVIPALLGIILAAISYSSQLTYAVIYIAGIGWLNNPGVYFTYLGLVGIVGSLFAGYLSDRLGRPAVAWTAVMILGIGTATLGIANTAPSLILVSSVLSGFGFQAALVVLTAWLIDIVDETSRATILSIQETLLDIVFGLGVLIFGMAGGWFGFQNAFMFMGFFVFLFSFLLSIKRHRTALL